MSTRKTVYVGNLPYTTIPAEISTLFGAPGRLIARVTLIQDPENNRLKGFGFVEFTNEQDAADVVKQFDGTQFGGRTLKVSIARNRNQH